MDLDAVVKASDQANLWIFLEHLTKRLSQNLSATLPPSSKRKDRTLQPGYLLQVTGTVENHAYSEENLNKSNEFLLEIKVMLTVFKEKPSLVLVFSDITERNLVTVLQENNNYKDRLLASVSHELRTPLNASINFTQSAIEHPTLADLPDVRDNYLLPALRSNQLLLHLINDILDFSQMSANKLRLVFENRNVEATIEECMSLVQIQATRKGLEISSELISEDDKFEFCTDHNRLKQIILNLLSNALKFTLKGSIRVSARISYFLPPSAQLINLDQPSSSKKYRVLHVTVTDTGIGISEEDKRKLFKAFEKIELGDKISINSQGVGLGLVISNNLVLTLGPPEQNNGMKVESSENRGSTFSFWIIDQSDSLAQKISGMTSHSEDNCSEMEEHNNSYIEGRMETLSNLLPIRNMKQLNTGEFQERLTTEPNQMRSNTELPIRLNTATEIPFRSCPKILIVDDDIFNITALQLILNQLGYSCDTAYNGQQAIEKVLERDSEYQAIGGRNSMTKSMQYKLIFMDWSMPIMDGLEATRILKEKMKNEEIENISIVACTAFVTDKEKVRATEYGVDAYCIKPLSKEVVRNTVKKYVPYKV